MTKKVANQLTILLKNTYLHQIHNLHQIHYIFIKNELNYPKTFEQQRTYHFL